MPKTYSEETKNEARRLRSEGYSYDKIGKHLDIDPSTARDWCKGEMQTSTPRPQKASKPSAVPKWAVDEMEQAASRVQSDYDDDEEPIELTWERAEKEASRAIKRVVQRTQFRWRAPGEHLILAFISDQHIAPGTPIDFKAMREDAELIRSTPNCYAILGGDGVDNHIKHRAAVLAARSQPEDQYRLYDYYLKLLGDRVLLMISGNHENWSNQYAGMDIVGHIARERRICYSPDVAYLDVNVGSQAYVVAVRHQYRLNSSFNQTHSVKQWLRLGEREFDIGCIGHHHEHAVESYLYRGQLRWGCRPGSYQITSAYSRQFGWNNSTPTTPAFLLRGDTKEIYGWPSVRAMVDSIRAARTIGVS